MRLLSLAVALALLCAATATATSTFAQSQPNYGPGGNSSGDTFGKPPSGSAQARQAYQHHRRYRR